MKLFAPHVCDGYKVGHLPMFPKGAEHTYGNLTARGDRLFLKSVSASSFWDHKVVWVGLQGVLKELIELWDESFFRKPKADVLARFARRMRTYLGEGKVATDALGQLHDLGYLPITVQALAEGSRVNMNIPLYVIYNTDPAFYWLTNYLETSMSANIWKMVTNATIAYEYRRVLEHWSEATGVGTDFVPFQGHDFSYRGVGGIEDGGRSSFPHLVSFAGTDTIPAIDYAEDYYNANSDEELIGASIPATEHAVATANILSNLKAAMQADYNKYGPCDMTREGYAEMRLQAEEDFIRRLITEVYPTGGISIVSDSFDFWGVVGKVLPNLKSEIFARQVDSNGLAKVVVRPDSGDPVEIICGVEVLSVEEAKELFKGNGGEAAPFYYRVPANSQDSHAPDRIFYASPISGVLRHRTWKELDDALRIEAGTDTWFKFEALTSKLRIYSSTDFPHGFEMLSQGLFEDLQQALGFLRVYDISVYADDVKVVGQYTIEERELTIQELGAVEALWNIFGGVRNDAGYRTLDSHIGLIYGDSITVQRTEEIMRRLANKKFAANNVVLGIGSYTYQYNTRDTFGQAIKGTAIQVNGEVVDLYKAPATEGDTNKKSAKGFLRVDQTTEGNYVLAQEQDLNFDTLADNSGDLDLVLVNGKFLREHTLAELRARLLG